MKLSNIILEAVDLSRAVPEDTSYEDFAKAVAKLLKEAYGTHNFKPFMETLHAELGINETIKESQESNIEKVEFYFIDNTRRLYGVYVHKADGTRTKIGRQQSEIQKFLRSLGIRTRFSYDNLSQITNALEAQGIEVETGEYDVS